MKLPKSGNVTCPKAGKSVNVEECFAHCLSCASNPKGNVCLEDMTIEQIDEDVRNSYTEKELEEES